MHANAVAVPRSGQSLMSSGRQDAAFSYKDPPTSFLQYCSLICLCAAKGNPPSHLPCWSSPWSPTPYLSWPLLAVLDSLILNRQLQLLFEAPPFY